MQINESRFGKQKYNRGHHVEGQWVFAGLESYSRRSFLIAVEKRRRNFVATHQEMDRAVDSYSFRQTRIDTPKNLSRKTYIQNGRSPEANKSSYYSLALENITFYPTWLSLCGNTQIRTRTYSQCFLKTSRSY